jgi:carboxylesterase type B
MLSDFLFHIPALSFGKLWSRFAPVYFYVFDYVATPVANSEDDVSENFGTSNKGGLRGPFDVPKGLQASHGTDLRFLMEGYKGSAEDRQVATPMTDFWINFIHKGYEYGI